MSRTISTHRNIMVKSHASRSCSVAMASFSSVSGTSVTRRDVFKKLQSLASGPFRLSFCMLAMTLRDPSFPVAAVAITGRPTFFAPQCTHWCVLDNTTVVTPPLVCSHLLTSTLIHQALVCLYRTVLLHPITLCSATNLGTSTFFFTHPTAFQILSADKSVKKCSFNSFQ